MNMNMNMNVNINWKPFFDNLPNDFPSDFTVLTILAILAFCGCVYLTYLTYRFILNRYLHIDKIKSKNKNNDDLLPLIRLILLGIYGNRFNLSAAPFANRKEVLLCLKLYKNGSILKDYNIDTKFITSIINELNKDKDLVIEKLDWSIERENFLVFIKFIFPGFQITDVLNQKTFKTLETKDQSITFIIIWQIFLTILISISYCFHFSN